MWAALRHRRGQVIALALVSALVATCAAFAPIFARSVDQGLLRTHVTQADAEQTATAISRPRTADARDVLPAEVAERVPADLAAVSGDPVEAMRQATRVVPEAGKQASPVVLRSRTDACDHLEVDGRCPQAAGEILVSGADAKAWGWKAGTTLEIPDDKYAGRYPNVDAEPPPIDLTVVGTYAVREDPGYWLGDRPDGKSGVTTPDLDNLPLVDDLITAEATFEGVLPKATATVLLPLDPQAATLDTLPAAAASARALEEEHPELDVDDSAATLVDGVTTGRSQTAIIVPFVTVQLALLSVLVLFLVAQSGVDQRRHDVALARLRGRSRAGARRLLLTELVVPVVLGLPVGFVCAVLLAVLVRRSMLPRGIPFEIPIAVLPWLLGSLVVSVLAVALAARPVLREPVNDLLRSVRPSSAGGSVVVEGVVVVLAVIGVVGLATGALSGPAALATPTLLAIAVGVLAARFVPRLAARRARSAMRRGRVAAAVAGHAVARRPAARRVLVVTTVATALAVFGANAVVVADRNRLARAELETGAPAVVSVDVATAPELLSAAGTLQESDIAAAPVAIIQPRDEDAEATLATDPQWLFRAANPDAVADLDPRPLALPDQEPIEVPGRTATARVSWDLASEGSEDPPELVLDLTTGAGDKRSARLTTLGPKARGSARVDADLFCTDDCRVAGIRVATSGFPGSSVDGTVEVSGLAVDGKPLPVTGPRTWDSDAAAAGRSSLTVTPKGDDLHLEVAALDGADVTAHVADVPRPLPAIAAGADAEVDDVRSVTDVAGGQTEIEVAQVVDALPAATDHGVLVSLPALARTSGELDTTRTQRQIWLGDASPATIERAHDLLGDADVPVRSVTTTAEADRVYDQSASAWGLQLALLGGVLAVILAALVLVVLAITGWRSSARDLAALRVSGVSSRAVGRALRTEHLTSVAIGVVLGALCALVGSWIALPELPLFTTPAAVPVADLAPAWLAVVAATLVVAIVLLVVARLIAGAIGRRVRLGAAQGEAT